jgi:hypothetical protein
LVERLRERDYNVVQATTEAELRRFNRRLEIPAGFTEAVLAGKPTKIRFNRTGNDLGADDDRVRIFRVVYTVLADFIVLTKDGTPLTPELLRKLAAEPRMLVLEVKPAGQRLNPPTGFEQSVPGTMVQFTLLVLFTSGAVTLTIERNQGILRRLASSPLSRGAVVLGKWGARMALGVIQIAFAMLTGSILFRIDWGPNLPMVMLVLVAYGALAASLGMLLGNFGRTEAQVIGWGVIAGNGMAGLGGCWWPIEVAPLWVQKLAWLFPTGWAMDAIHKLVNFGASPLTVFPHLCLTVGAALGAGYILSRSFRFQ